MAPTVVVLLALAGLAQANFAPAVVTKIGETYDEILAVRGRANKFKGTPDWNWGVVGTRDSVGAWACPFNIEQLFQTPGPQQVQCSLAAVERKSCGSSRRRRKRAFCVGEAGEEGGGFNPDGLPPSEC
jgi:hypothetical protein